LSGYGEKRKGLVKKMYEIKILEKLRELTGLESIKLSSPPPKIQGDISTNAAMASGKDPEEIIGALKELDAVEDAVKVGPGFINISLKTSALHAEIAEIISDPQIYGRQKTGEKIIFEMVSSNPTGPLHIGHGRGAAIGDSLARIYERYGYDVYREYYVNDTGKQMTLLGKSIYNTISGKPVPENGYKGEYIADIAKTIKDCSSADECARRASDMILKEHLDVLKKFRVSYDNVFYESKLIETGEVHEVIRLLKEKNLTYEKEGALWFRSTEFGDDADRVLIKQDGELTYFASDCAYHKDKAQRFPALINFWGADHHGYVPRLKAFWEALGLKGSLDILLYQLVNLKRGEEKISMSTRQGEFVTLEEVVDEVGADAARFFMLMRSSDSPLEFDVGLAKENSKKNPVYYVQYSHARICSVFLKAGRDFSSLSSDCAKDLGSEEREMIKALARFPYLLYKCVDLKAPHLMTEYLREVANLFHKYYDSVRVIGSKKEEARLVLLKAVKEVIKNGLELCGVSAPEKM